MRGLSRFNVRWTSGTGLAVLLVLVMLGTCAVPSTTSTATFDPTATVMDAVCKTTSAHPDTDSVSLVSVDVCDDLE